MANGINGLWAYQLERKVLLKLMSSDEKAHPYYELLKAALPSSKQSKFILQNWALYLLSRITHTAAVQMGAQSLVSLLNFLILRDDKYLKEAMAPKTLGMLGGAVLSTYMLSNLRNSIVNHITSLSKQDFINKIMEWEGETHSVSIWNNRNPGQSLNLNEVAESYAEYMNVFLSNDNILYLTLGIAVNLAFTYLSGTSGSVVPMPFYLLWSRQLLSIAIEIPVYLFREQAKEEQTTNADLAAFTSNLEKGDYSQIGVYSLIPALYEKLGSYVHSTSSLSKLYKISIGLMDLSMDLVRRAVDAAPLLGSFYFGTGAFAYEISDTIINPFLIKKQNSNSVLALIRKFGNILEPLHLLKPKFVRKDFDNTALELRNNSIILPNQTVQAKLDYIKVQYGKITVVKGPSGCGKTMLVNIMTGHSDLLSETFNRDEKLDDTNTYSVPAVTYITLPKTSWLEFITGQPEVTTGNFAELDRLKEVLMSLKLDDFCSKLDEQMARPSNGEFKRMIVAKAIFNKAKFIALDETFSSISDDEDATFNKSSDREDFLRLVHKYARSNEAAIVCVTHDNLTYKKDGVEVTFADSIIEFKKSDKARPSHATNYYDNIEALKEQCKKLLEPIEDKTKVLEILRSPRMTALIYSENVDNFTIDEFIDDIFINIGDYFITLVQKLKLEKGEDLIREYQDFEKSLPPLTFPLFTAKQMYLKSQDQSISR